MDAEGAAEFTVSRRIVLDDIDWNVVSQVRAVPAVPHVLCLPDYTVSRRRIVQNDVDWSVV